MRKSPPACRRGRFDSNLQLRRGAEDTPNRYPEQIPPLRQTPQNFHGLHGRQVEANLWLRWLWCRATCKRFFSTGQGRPEGLIPRPLPTRGGESDGLRWQAASGGARARRKSSALCTPESLALCTPESSALCTPESSALCTPDLTTVTGPWAIRRCPGFGSLVLAGLDGVFHRTREARRPDPPPASHSWRGE